MWRVRLGQWLILCAVVLAAIPASADEVELLNGNRLSGTVMKMEDDVLIFSTDYAGELKIAWGKVRSITTDQPMRLKVPGPSNGIVSDFLLGGYDFIETNHLGAEMPVPFAKVKGINIGMILYRGNFTLGGNSTSGNTDTKAINAAGRLTVRADRHRLFLEAKYNYGEADDRVTARNSMAQAKYDYFISKRVFIDAFGLWEKDTFQNLQFRNTLGAGLGYQFLDSGRANLSISFGAGYVNEHFTNAPNTQTPSSRWGVRYEQVVIEDRLTMFHKQDGFYDLNAGNALRLLADQGVRIFLNKHFFFSLEYDLRLNTQPAPGREKVDEAFIFAIGYQLQ